MKPKTWTHPKFSMLAAALGGGRAKSAGILEGIWHLAATFDPEGGTLPYTPQQLTTWLETDLDPETLAAGLVDCGWLEGTPGAYLVHDWEDHKPNYIRETERKRNYRAQLSRDNPGTSRDNPDVSRNVALAADHSDSDSDSVCKTEEASASSSQQRTAAGTAGDRKLFVLPLTGGCSYRVPTERIDEYRAAYAWDVNAEISKASLWLKDNPARRPKTHRAAAAFLTRWLNRHDDRQRAGGQHGKGGDVSAAEYKQDLARRHARAIAYATGNGKTKEVARD